MSGRDNKRFSSFTFSVRSLCKIIFGLGLVLFSLGVLGAAAVLGLLLRYASEVPPVETLQSYNPSLVTRIYAADGSLLADFALERRILIPLEQIPRELKEAVLAVEDADFFTHRGLDPKAITRAFLKNLMAGEIVQGGSTITQQVARAMFLTPERRITRKIKEAILAYRIEKHFSKEDILGLYLNHIYLGQGSYGVEAASHTYFGKRAHELSLLECAILAGLPKAPNRYSPLNNPANAVRRARHVIARMVEEGYLTVEEAEAGLGAALILGSEKKASGLAPFFVEYIRQYVERNYGYEGLYRGGLAVYTTLDPVLQKEAEEAIREGLRALDKRRGYRGPKFRLEKSQLGDIEAYVSQQQEWPERIGPGGIYLGIVLSVSPKEAVVRVGPVEGVLPLGKMRWVYGRGREKKLRTVREMLQPGDVIEVEVIEGGDAAGKVQLALEQEPEVEGALINQDVRTGAILAMVGGYDFGRSQFNRATQARRQPGSAFKPFVYAAAIENGFTPADIIIDSPIIYENREEEAQIKMWKPENYEERFFGPTRLRVALNHSRNVVTIKLLRDVGIRKVIDLVRRMGVASPLSQDLTLALGSSGITLQELTTAFGTFANHGIRNTPYVVLSVVDRNGVVLESHRPEALRVLDDETAYIVTDMLQTVVTEGTGWRVKALGRPVAGKTGTTNDYVDAWFLGYTPELVTGVWVGLDRKESLGRHETGSRAASPIWLSFMKAALKTKPASVFRVPSGVVFVKIDSQTGLLAQEEAPEAVFEVFKEGTVPREVSRTGPPRPGDFYRFDL